MGAREMMTAWVLEALRSRDGSATILEISKEIWRRHEEEIRGTGDLMYEWQYEMRWAGDLLRRQGVLSPARDTPRGTWRIAEPGS